MLISTIIPVSADYDSAEIIAGKAIPGWSEMKTTGSNLGGIEVGLTDGDAKSGEYSLCAVFPNKNLASNNYYLTNTDVNVSVKAGKTYTVGVWYKVDPNVSQAFRAWTFFAVGDASIGKVYELSKTDSGDVDGWKHRYYTFTATGDKEGPLYFGFCPNFSHVKDREEIKILFDDIYFVEDGSDVNFVSNPGFEAEVDEPPVSGFLPEIIEGRTMTGWSDLINGGGEDKGVRVGSTDYDAKSGDYSLCVTFPNKKTWQKDYLKNTKTQVNLEAGKTYKFGVWYKTDENITKVHQAWPFFAVGNVDTIWDLATTESEAVDGWKHRFGTVTVNQDITGYLHFGFDPNFAHITDQTEINILFDDIYFCEEGIDVNLVYNAGFEETNEDSGEEPEDPPVVEPDEPEDPPVVEPDEPEDPPVSSSGPEILSGMVMNGWGSLINASGEDKGVRVGPTDYDAKSGSYSLCAIFPNIKTYQKDYFKNTNTQVTLETGKTYKIGVWYKVDDAITKQHQAWPFFAVGSIDGVWDLTTTETERVDGWKHRWATISVDSNTTGYLYFGFEANFAHVTDRTEVKYLFDDIYVCEEGSDVNLVDNASFEELFVDPNIPEFEINAPILYKGNAKVDSVDYGTYKVQTKVRNNKLQEAVPVMQMVALYKGNILKKLVTAETVAEKLEASDASTVLECTIEVPSEDSDQYHLEVFIWDSKAGMNSLYDFVTFE